jgi:hypothetical protein
MKKKFLIISLLFIQLFMLQIKDVKSGDLTCEEWIIEKDEQGFKETCRDQYPTLNERIRFARTNIDPFDTTYKITHQWCWVRYFDGTCRFCIIPGWEDTCVNAWGPKLHANYYVDDIGSRTSGGGKKTVFIHSFCLKKFPPKDYYLHNDNAQNPTNRTKVCAYYVQPFPLASLAAIAGGGLIGGVLAGTIAGAITDGNQCNMPMIDWDHALVGCVDSPIKPGPQTYNETIPPGMAPMVDNSIGLEDFRRIDGILELGYISLGSKFDQPVVRLLEIAGISTVENALLLRYKFPGDTTVYDDIPACGQFAKSSNKNTYCAIVDEENPSEVCVCQESKCAERSYLGCVPRPTPAQSHYKIMPKYTPFIDAGVTYPALDISFIRMTNMDKVRYIDADGAVAIEAEDGNKYKYDTTKNVITTVPAVEPLTYDKLALPLTPITLPEYYVKGDSTTPVKRLAKGTLDKKIYGVDFSANIPKFTEAGEFDYIWVETPGSRSDTAYGDNTPINERPDGCGTFTKVTSPNTLLPLFMVPAGERIRDLCCPEDMESKAYCPIPPATPCRNGTLIPHDLEAVKAVCPGIYKKPEDPSKADKICLMTSNGWNLLPINESACVEIPVATYGPAN